MQDVVQNDIVAKAMVQAALNVKICEPFVGVIVRNDKDPIAAFIFNNFDRQNVDLTVIANGLITMRSARAIARYVFENSGVERVTCVTRMSNTRARQVLRRLGFSREGVLRNRFSDDDGEIFSLLKEEQRFIHNRNIYEDIYINSYGYN